MKKRIINFISRYLLRFLCMKLCACRCVTERKLEIQKQRETFLYTIVEFYFLYVWSQSPFERNRRNSLSVLKKNFKNGNSTWRVPLDEFLWVHVRFVWRWEPQSISDFLGKNKWTNRHQNNFGRFRLTKIDSRSWEKRTSRIQLGSTGRIHPGLVQRRVELS